MTLTIVSSTVSILTGSLHLGFYWDSDTVLFTTSYWNNTAHVDTSRSSQPAGCKHDGGSWIVVQVMLDGPAFPFQLRHLTT